VNAPIKAPASNTRRGADELVVMDVLPCVEALSGTGEHIARADGFPDGSFGYFSIAAQSETSLSILADCDDKGRGETEID
jgi:hypothetical protein